MKKIIFTILFILLILLTWNTKIYAEDIKLEKVDYTESYLKWLELPENERKQYYQPVMTPINLSKTENITTYSLFNAKLAISLQDEFDLRDVIKVEVKNQMNTNACWAFSANSILETNLELMENETLDFSEKHMNYATARSSFINGEINEIGFSREASDGGNPYISMAYYTRGQGPILESEMPYTNDKNNIDISEIYGKEVVKQVRSYEIFPSIVKSIENGNITYTNGGTGNNLITYSENQVQSIRNKIKEHIKQYGAVSAFTSDVNFNSYYNTSTHAYYCDDKNISMNHQVTIIGWDDNYAIDNFNTNNRPANPGAYIVLNSWGESFGDNGIYYISYDDVLVEVYPIGIRETSDVEYDNIYQHDIYGGNSYFFISMKNDIYGANVFERDVSKNEMISQIGILIPEGTRLEIFVNPNDGEISEAKLEKVTQISEKLPPGYHTIDLDMPIKLTGNKFAVVIHALDSNKVFVETDDDAFYKYAKSERGESFIGISLDLWADLKDYSSIKESNTNLCIKAFTIKDEENVTSNIYEVEGRYIYKIPSNTTVKELLDNINIKNGEAKIYEEEKQLSNSTKIKTGNTLEVGNDKYYLAVAGDINKDGNVNVIDLARLKLHLINMNKLSGIDLKAGDINGDRNINIVDLSRIKLIILNINL